MRPTDPRVLGALRPARPLLAGVLGAGVLASLLVVVQAFAVTGLVVALVDGGDVAGPALSTLAVFALRAATGAWGDVRAARAATVVGTHLRRRIVGAVLRRTPQGGTTDATGRTSVLATRGVASAEPYLTRYLPAAALALVLPALTVVVIATQDLLSAVIVLLTLPLMPVFGILVGLATRDRAREQWRAMSSLSGHFLDVVRGLPTLVVFRRARAQSAAIADATERYRRASLATLRVAFASSAVLELVATLSVALVAVTIGLRLASGSVDLRTALVVLLLAPEAYWPVRRVGAEFHAAAEGLATFEEVAALDVGEPGAAAAPVGRDLVVRDLVVRHPGAEGPAVDRVSLQVAARGVTVLTGVSGCGKTTLVETVAGLRPAESGSVTVGGVPVGGDGWRSQVAWVAQRPVFLAGTIADNLRLAVPDASDDRLWAALRSVLLEERVHTLARGLDTDLAEDGGSLSAGERARLALARAVLARRPWVLLDEPTSHLDDLTEQVILDTVADLGRTSGVLMVSHRPAAATVADRLIVLEAPAAPDTRAVSADTRAVSADTRAVSPDTRAVSAGWRGGWGSAVLGSLASGSGVALTATAGWLIVQASTRPAVLTLMVAIVGVRAFGLARPVLRYAERVRSHDAALRILAERRVEVYDALVPLVPGALAQGGFGRRGDLLASVVDDVDSAVDRELRVRLPVRTAVAVTTAAGALAAGIALRPGLAVGLTTLLAGGVAFGLARVGAGRAERAGVRLRAELSTQVVEVVQTAPELVMWQAVDRAGDRVAATSDALGRALVRAARWSAAGQALALLLAGVSVAATAVLAAPLVATGDLSGPLAALLVLLPVALVEVTAPLADSGARAARTAAAARRLGLLRSTRPLVTDDAVRALPEGADLDLVDVSVGWPAPHDAEAVRRAVPALEHLDLRLREGERLGVVGRSGSGKSTLASMLLRFVDPQHGRADLGGTPMAWLGLDDLRSVVGLVDDDPHVFATTLLENVRLARPGASRAQVIEALRQACLGPWLDALPEGLDTWLGDGHAQVSGGERARLGIARVLLAGQRVVVLDEPVAHLDHATAARLAEEVLLGAPGRSVVWITHDRTGLEHVDAVLDLDDVRRRTREDDVSR